MRIKTKNVKISELNVYIRSENKITNFKQILF